MWLICWYLVLALFKFLYLLILQIVKLQLCNNKDITEKWERKMPHHVGEEALDYQLTENNAIPIKGHRLFKNLYKLVVPCPSFIRSDRPQLWKPPNSYS